MSETILDLIRGSNGHRTNGKKDLPCAGFISNKWGGNGEGRCAYIPHSEGIVDSKCTSQDQEDLALFGPPFFASTEGIDRPTAPLFQKIPEDPETLTRFATTRCILSAASSQEVLERRMTERSVNETPSSIASLILRSIIQTFD